MRDPFVKIEKLTKQFNMGRERLYAVRNFSLDLARNEIVGLVGESGCGKSTVGRTTLYLTPPSSGRIQIDGVELSTLSKKELKAMRRRMQMIFQDPVASLNPRMTVQDIIKEPLDIHKQVRKEERAKRVEKLLNLVGLNASHLSRFPHEFSGGQRQRIGIARALAVEPDFLVCDEPLSALDVSIQAQIINLLKELKEQLNLTILFIAHDLSLVKYLCDRVAVMYLGELMELAPAESLYAHPLHPYTQALLSAIPIPDPKVERKRRRIPLQGEVPSPLHPPKGCPFASRCPQALSQCHREKPLWKEVKPSHFTACHLF